MIKCDMFFQKKNPFVTLVTLQIQVPTFQDRFKSYHLFGTRFKSYIQYDAGFGHIGHRSGCFLEDEFHLHQGHFCHFNDYLRGIKLHLNACLIIPIEQAWFFSLLVVKVRKKMLRSNLDDLLPFRIAKLK